MIRRTQRAYKRRRTGLRGGSFKHTERYIRTTWWFLFVPVLVVDNTMEVTDF